MIRRAFRVAVTGACLLSLLLCAGAGWLWRRSQTTSDVLVCSTWDAERGVLDGSYVFTNPGEIGYIRSHDVLRGSTLASVRKEWPHSRHEPWGHTTGRFFPPYPYGIHRTNGLVAYVADWHVMLVSALPPLLWLGSFGRRRFVARRRRGRGRCVSCGYDLTGNVSGRCSECGREAPSVGRAEPR